MGKIKLKEIKVKSFVTTLSVGKSNTLIGGSDHMHSREVECFDITAYSRSTVPTYTSSISGSTSDTTWSGVRETISKQHT